VPLGERELCRARAYLSRVAEPPAPALSELITEVGPVRAATGGGQRLGGGCKQPGSVASMASGAPAGIT